MKTRLLILLILLSSPGFAPAQTALKTFNKTFNTEGKGVAILDLPGTIEVKIWDNPNIRIEISVGLASGNAGLLNELANVGRYNLTAKPDAEALLIQMPGMLKKVTIKGEELKEVLSFVVSAPASVKIKTNNTALTVAGK
jgi:hypothetical protein